MTFLVGVDLGQASDWTAIATLQREARPTGRKMDNGEMWDDHYSLVGLQRPALRTPYPEIVGAVGKVTAHPKLVEGGSQLIVDATGVGRPVVDMMRVSALEPVPVTITGGAQVTQTEGFWHVPKRVLVSTMAIVLQTGRLHIRKALPLGATLQREMLAFKVKVNTRTGNDSYEAWRDGEHDDLVLAVALALWWGERSPTGGFRRDPGADMKEKRRIAHLEKREQPWWKQGVTVDDRGEAAWWKKS